MNVEQLEQQIERLPRQDLARLVGWFDRFLDREPVRHSVAPVDLSEDEQAELRRRRDELLAHPDLARPMDDKFFDDLKRRFADERAGKTSVG